MQVTKYPQSCLRVEKDGGVLLLDPGVLGFGGIGLDELGHVDAVLFTHQHADHLDQELAAALASRGATIVGNGDVAAALPELEVVEARDGEALEVAGFGVLPRDLDHVVMVNGAEGPPNTGFLLDGTLFHPGDGIRLDGLTAEVLALPIAGPSISNRDAYLFLSSTGAGRAIPIHYDVFPGDPHLFARNVDIADVIILDPGESTTV